MFSCLSLQRKYSAFPDDPLYLNCFRFHPASQEGQARVRHSVPVADAPRSLQGKGSVFSIFLLMITCMWLTFFTQSRANSFCLQKIKHSDFTSLLLNRNHHVYSISWIYLFLILFLFRYALKIIYINCSGFVNLYHIFLLFVPITAL